MATAAIWIIATNESAAKGNKHIVFFSCLFEPARSLGVGVCVCVCAAVGGRHRRFLVRRWRREVRTRRARDFLYYFYLQLQK